MCLDCIQRVMGLLGEKQSRDQQYNHIDEEESELVLRTESDDWEDSSWDEDESEQRKHDRRKSSFASATSEDLEAVQNPLPPQEMVSVEMTNIANPRVSKSNADKEKQFFEEKERPRMHEVEPEVEVPVLEKPPVAVVPSSRLGPPPEKSEAAKEPPLTEDLFSTFGMGLSSPDGIKELVNTKRAERKPVNTIEEVANSSLLGDLAMQELSSTGSLDAVEEWLQEDDDLDLDTYLNS